jgi:1-phosphatidylinositol-3-phosphate 5-kinase
MKRLLTIAIYNDSMYLTRHQIIDYSMFVAIDPIRRTIRFGIIDYVQQYTIEKQLESVVKETISGLEPTIIPPELYK